MKEKHKRIGKVLAIALLLVALFLAPFFQETYNDQCPAKAKGDSEQCSAEHVISLSFSRAGQFLRDNHDVIIALGTLFIALFTFTLWRSTEKLWDAGERQINLAEEQHRTTKAIQRAYVTLNERNPIRLGNGVSPGDGDFTISVVVKNWGATPAVVTAISMVARVFDSLAEVPIDPPYGDKDTDFGGAFLVSQDAFESTHSLHVSGKTLTGKEFVTAIENGTKVLLILGYVDYSDKFGIRHRSGFAREYIPPPPNTIGSNPNLKFVAQKGYSYDCERA